MGDLFLQPFAGGADVEPDHSTKLLGGVLKTVQDGAGTAYRDGATGTVMYRYDELPGRSDYGLQLKTKFANPSGVGARVRLCLDVVDSDNYLYVEVTAGSAAGGWAGLGHPQMKMGKVVAGADSSLVDPFAVNGDVALVADQLYLWEVVRKLDPRTGDVTYELRFEASWLDDPRPAAAATLVSDELSHENRATGWHFTTANGTDLKIDDLRCFELTEAVVDASGRVLVVGGESLDGAAMVARGISPVEATNNFLDGSRFTFTEAVPWGQASFRAEQYVVWRDEGKVVFRGYVTAVQFGGAPGAQFVAYSCRGRKHRMGYVPVRHPVTLAQRVVWNSPDNLDYVNSLDKAAFTGKTYGQIVRWYFSQVGEEMRKQGAARPDAVLPYSEADLAALDALTPVRTELTGNALQQIVALLGQLQAYAFVHEVSTDLWRFYKVTGLAPIALETEADLLVASSLSEDSTNVYTRVCSSTMHRERVHVSDADDQSGKILDAWEDFFEENWTPDKARRASVAAIVTAVNLGAGPLGEDEIEVEYPVTPRSYTGEWLNGQVRVTSGAATGETFGLLLQDCDVVSPWAGTIRISGNFVGVPVPTDTIVLEAISDLGQRNQFADVFSSFRIADPDKLDLVMPGEGGCPKVKTYFPSVGDGTDGADADPAMQEQTAHRVFKGPGFVNGLIWVPVGGTYDPNPTAAKPQNLPGAYQKPTKTVLEYDYWKLTVLAACKPTAGFSGTGFALDPAKWAGGGEAGPNDLNIQRVLPLEEADWRDTTQTEIVKARLQEILDVVSQRQFVGQPELAGLRYEFSDLGKSLELTSPAGALPWAGLYILPVSVSYRYSSTGAGDRTQVSLGGTSSFAATGQAFSSALRAETMLERLKANAAKLRDFQNCLGNAAPQDGETPPPEDPNGVCDTRVTTSFHGAFPRERTPGAGKPKKLKEDLDVILWFLLLVAANKAAGEGITVHPADGTNGDDPYATDAAGVPMAPNADGTGWIRLSDGTPYAPVYGGATGAALANLGKTFANGTGALLPPGSVVPAGGAFRYNPDGSIQVLGAGSTVPGSLASIVAANKKSAEGLTVNSNGTVTAADGSVYVANQDGSWTRISGAGPLSGPLFGGALAAALGNLGKSFLSVGGAEAPPGAPIPGGGIDRYNPDGSISHIAGGGGALVPGSAGSQAAANKKLMEGATVNGDGSVTFPNGRFQPRDDGGWTPVPGSGAGGSTPLTGPQIGGAAGGSAAKCGTTMSGATTPGSGPGALLPPGTVVDADRGIYYLPTQAIDDPDAVVLEAGEIVPASTLDQWQALARSLGLEAHDLSDPGGVVYRTPVGGGLGVRYWRVLAGTQEFVEVEDAGAGAGLNGGDWDDVAGPVEFNPGIPFRGVRVVPADDDLLQDDNGKVLLVEAAAADVTIALDHTAGVFVAGRFSVTVKLAASPLGNVAILDPSGGDTIDGAATLTLSEEFDSVVLVRVAGGWHVVAQRLAPSTGTFTPQSGWGDPTGVLARTTFVGGGATLNDVSKRLAALVTDLKAAGILLS